MRTIVVGDIHGCYNELVKLIDSLKEKELYDAETDKIIFLGDYIDRGNQSREVISYIRAMQENNDNVIALMGNHENMLLDYMDGYSRDWLYNGCDSTVNSYNNHEDELASDIEWMENLPVYFEDDNFIYVHAGIDKGVSIDEQSEMTMLWTRDEFIWDSTEYDKKVIFGHTPTQTINKDSKPIMTVGGDIGIDTGCVFGGKLTALVIDGGEIKKYIQIQKGE